ncbi:MAG: aspartate aminotransferase family protein [Candidatus Sedimenticola endophacoides]|uniref:Acetylornithine aminotransferase n=1 Tax=Candidatus Sedimenticola endophacoides TaxID=2548426 RepID=A0A6N4DRZ5_9GAMM|nr:MAG: aspartate aminotransferase family protein [Candidatus Sedimenticola endophacoides]OQX40684.1 MAG: aspartate aminotransferase family protein [Candidatus Sedimenticola endophacoides]PUE00051.1 MAG: aspartate aminotransferase family protein [Candidatus Sedimenticola endophacoides]PUE01724.1 MAG: aspartate aminotransferase family protein [Candidatus Sedimenticola endophacoides]PUE03649.1 MAG: aspartate aminotransferase family protein [Candidatus Sedimenticola endophacoides]
MPGPLMETYRRLPVSFERGEGAWLWDSDDKRYLDALSGIAVCGLGHAHPALRQALCDQAGRLIHTSNLYGIELQERLGGHLTRLAGMRQVFFSNSGAEANEAAIKLARLYGHQRGITNPAIVVMEGSFHGRTLATLSATGNRKVQAGFEPLVSGFVRVPYGDIEAIRSTAANSHNIVAVLVEPVQGEGGINIPADDYLNGIRALCDEHGWLMMLDEIQTGMARSGRMFSFQHNRITPDVMTLAKGLGNGVPIGACLASGRASGVLTPGTHGSTFGGNPLACAAALAVVETLEREQFASRAQHLGERLLCDFADALSGVAGVEEIRGQGLLLGIELDRPCGELVERALERGLLINVTAERVIRLLPPLIFSDRQAAQLVELVTEIIKEFLEQA